MKRIKNLLSLLMLALLASVSFSSCKEDPELSVDRSVIPVEGTGETVDLNIYANEEAGKWTITNEKSWVQLSLSQGSQNKVIKVTVKKNETTEPREAVLTINSLASAQTVKIEQDAGKGSLSVKPETVTVSAAGGIQNIRVESNTSWTISGSNEWCKPSTFSDNGSKDVTLNIEQNKDVEKRENVLTISTSDGNASKTVKVVQEGIKESLEVSPEKLTFLPQAYQSKRVTINATGKWKITPSQNVDWLNYDSEGTGNTTIEVATKSANESAKTRSVNLVVSLVSNSSIKRTISIVQEPLYSDIYVKPADWVSIYDELYEVYEIAWEYAVVENTHSVNLFRYMILPENDLQNWTKKEILRELEKQELLKFSLGWLSTIVFDSNNKMLQPNTKYHYFSIAYDENDNPGDLYEDILTTPQRYSATDDAYVGFNNIGLLTTGYSFMASPEGRAKKYHVIYGNNNDAINLGATFAFQINYYLKYNKKHWYTEGYGFDIQTDYPNAHQFVHYAPGNLPLSLNPMITGWGWGIFENGNRSTCVTGFDIDISSNVKEYKKAKGRKSASSSKMLTKKRYDSYKSDLPKMKK